MNSNTPPQDSDAEIDELLEYWFRRFHDRAVGNNSAGFYSIKAEAKQAIQALRKRWENQARIDELKQVLNRYDEEVSNNETGRRNRQLHGIWPKSIRLRIAELRGRK